MNIDIVVPVRSTRRYPIESYLNKFIETLTAHTKNFRLILVDDNSDAEGASLIDGIAKQRRDTLLIRSNYQRWFTKTVNLGLRFARTEWTAVLNTDTEYGPGWLEEMLAVRDEVAQHQKVGLVGSEFSVEEPRRYESTVPGGYVTGHCWLLNIHAVSEVSAQRGTPGIYLDETQVQNLHIRSDVHMCWDLNKLGWATVKSFKAAVGHHGGKSWGHDLYTVGQVTLSDIADDYK